MLFKTSYQSGFLNSKNHPRINRQIKKNNIRKGGLNVFYIQIADIIGKISKDLQPFKFKGTFAFKKNGH